MPPAPQRSARQQCRADTLALHVLKTYEAADRLVPEREEEAIDTGAVADTADDYTTIGGRAIVDAFPESSRDWS